MALVTLDSISLAFGHKKLLDNVSLAIESGEKISLIGRNGEGKSTFLKILSGAIKADDGNIVKQSSVVISVLDQKVDSGADITVYEEVIDGLKEVKDLLNQYHHLIQNQNLGEAELIRLEEVQHKLESNDGWEISNKVNTVISKLELDPDAKLSDLSGGWLRRVYLAKALVQKPDILLLDEPTNHLDIEAIKWLEDFLISFQGAVLFITHDRALLQKVATRILEQDRGIITSWPGNYENFLRRKDEQLNAEMQENERFDKKLSKEEEWIRQGIKARRTRNEGRVRALLKMREEFRERRTIQGKAGFSIEAAEISGKIVIEAKKMAFSWDEKKIVDNFSMKILRGDKVALIGPNGCGKTTFINLLLKKIAPNAGSVRHGTKLELSYFDQLRSQLDPEKTVADNISDGKEHIEINGSSRHIIGYLGDFLFTPEKVRTPVKALSGGECNRLLLAKLFSKPSNFLILDEPTNDLDIESLELLEELLSSFKGTVILVSHDRKFMNNVVTSSLFFEGNGKVIHYSGGYDDVIVSREALSKQERKAAKPNEIISENKEENKRNPAREQKPVREIKKLGYMEQRELDALPDQMDLLEQEIEALQNKTMESDFYQRDHSEVTKVVSDLEEKQKQFEEMFERWEFLDSKS